MGRCKCEHSHTALSITIHKQRRLVDTVDNAVGWDVLFCATKVRKSRVQIGYVDNVTCNGTRLDNIRPAHKCGNPNTTFSEGTFATRVNSEGRHVGEEFEHRTIIGK